MRTTQPREWADQQAELRATEQGATFLAILENIVETAENRIDQGEDAGTALRVGIAEYEAVANAVLRTDVIGKLFVLLMTFWKHGYTLHDDLTAIEVRLAVEQLAAQLLELQNEARVDGTAEGEPSDA